MLRISCPCQSRLPVKRVQNSRKLHNDIRCFISLWTKEFFQGNLGGGREVEMSLASALNFHDYLFVFNINACFCKVNHFFWTVELLWGLHWGFMSGMWFSLWIFLALPIWGENVPFLRYYILCIFLFVCLFPTKLRIVTFSQSLFTFVCLICRRMRELFKSPTVTFFLISLCFSNRFCFVYLSFIIQPIIVPLWVIPFINGKITILFNGIFLNFVLFDFLSFFLCVHLLLSGLFIHF